MEIIIMKLIVKHYEKCKNNKTEYKICLDKDPGQSQQYQAKNRRKQQGRKLYQQFVAKKEKQTMTRKIENVQKQKLLIQNNMKLSQQAGWKKVAANVALKQGEHKGKKQTTRMRQAIINKKNDQVN